MQTANIMVALGGDTGNTVPRYRTTTAEVAILRAIHGEDAVFDIERTADINVPNKAELARLKEQYGGPNTRKLVETMYPGVAARVFESFDELDLPDELFKRDRNARVEPVPTPDAPVSETSATGFVAEPGDTDDGFGEMPDRDKLFS